jgi:hypothetical protein
MEGTGRRRRRLIPHVHAGERALGTRSCQLCTPLALERLSADTHHLQRLHYITAILFIYGTKGLGTARQEGLMA